MKLNKLMVIMYFCVGGYMRGVPELKTETFKSIGNGVHYIDLLEIMGKTEEWSPDITKDLEEKGKKWEKEVRDMQHKLEQDAKTFKEKADMLSNDAKQEEQDRLIEKGKDIENKVKINNEKMQRAAQTAQANLNKRLEEAVAEMAKKNGWSMVIGRGPTGVLYVIYVAEKMDDTSFVLNELKLKYSKKDEKSKK